MNLLPLPSRGEARAMRRLLVALERPEQASHVLDVVTQLSRALGAEVLVACTVERDPRWSGLYDAEVSAADASVRAVVERLTQAGVSASGEVVVTLAGRAGAIDEAADEFGADLLVIATSTSRLFGLLGSGLARRLIRSSSRPVLLVPNRRRPGPWRGPDRPRDLR